MLFLVCESGCSGKGKNYEVPAAICGISIERSTLKQLLPDGDKLRTVSDHTARVPEHRFCDVYVDDHTALSTEGVWEKAGFTAQQAAKDKLIFQTRSEKGGKYAVWEYGAATVIDCANVKQKAARFSIEVELVDHEGDKGEKIAKFLSGFAAGYKKTLSCEN